MVCQNPTDYGFEISHWSLPYLRLAIEKAGFALDISESTINRMLNDVEVRPHKQQYWLHSKEKYESPETYDAKSMPSIVSTGKQETTWKTPEYCQRTK